VKIIRQTPIKDDRTRVTIELDPGETMIVIRRNSHYKLSDPVNDVVASHIISDAVEVEWCSFSQAWVA
jgi:hypothetical protein